MADSVRREKIMRFTDDIRCIKGVGDKTAATLNKIGISTIGGLLYFFPRDYSQVPFAAEISHITPGVPAIIRGKVTESPRQFSARGKMVVSFPVSDGSGSLEVSFFGMPYMKKTVFRGKELLLYGRVVSKNGRLLLAQPKLLTEAEYQAKAGTLQPVYRLPKGMTNQAVQKLVRTCLGEDLAISEYLPEEIVRKESLLPVAEAIRMIHFPETMERVTIARQRLAFDEFYLFLLQLSMLKGKEEHKKKGYRIEDFTECRRLVSKLPFSLTVGQEEALTAIEKELESGYQMNRLVQGDVGCGKTIVAFLAMLAAVSNGYQAVLMAPTEVLAAQHFADICDMADRYGLSVKPGLLVGSMTAKEKRERKKQIEAGELNFIIGTHALIQDSVKFASLALTVCDEQHRFGVAQRMHLSEKGISPHILVMSATPIPRTLGLILYGDLDVSLIRELPASRKPIKNTVVGPEYRAKLYKFIMKQILEGRQAYIICPMVEENEELDIENVTTYSEELKTVFPASVRIGCLHGKMKPSEKDAIMEAFSNNEIQILVSTTVVEVGVNVPNATVMMVENAERFGLSQLHQLRGRVGRGSYQSYCIFLIGKDTKKARERLAIMAKTNDGFEIANEDLRQRGPGDFFGLRQAGMPGFQIADIYSDAILLERVKAVLESQPKEQLRDLYEKLLTEDEMHFRNLHDVCL